MRAKKVYESKFQKGKKPVGMDSPEGIDRWIKSWQNKGVKFGWQFFQGDDVEKKRDFVGKYYKQIDKYLNKLNEVGVPFDNITMWGDHLDVKTYQLLKGNWSLFHCLTEEDAKMVKKVIENMTTGSTPVNITEDSDHINISEAILRETDKEHKEWMERRKELNPEGYYGTDLDFLDKIQDTRKKLKSIL